MADLRIAGADDAGTPQMIDGIRMATEIVMRPVADLMPYARNTKKHGPKQIAAIAESMKTYGFTNPVLVADGGLLAGHGRLLAAEKIGLKRVPTIDLSHLTPEQRRAYVIWDNRSAEIDTSWDLDMLKLETDELRAIGIDLEAETGFSEEDLAKLLEGIEDEEEGDGTGDPDAIPDVPVEPLSRHGDIWICGDHRIACMDSLSLADWERLMMGDMARLCVTDPPYNVAYESKLAGSIKNDDMADAEFRKFLKGAYEAMFENMEAGAPMYVAHADTEGYNFRGAMIDAGFKLSGCLIWRKQSLVLGRSDWQWQHEPILYGWKPGARHRWFGGRKRTTVVEYGEDSPFQRMPDGRWAVSVAGQTLIVDGDAEVEAIPGSVIFHDKPSRSDLHPTTKPVGLWLKLIEPSSRPGDIVIDAFSGSGTTLIACEMSGRRARVAELDPKFVDVAVRRWEMFTGKKAVHAFTGEEFPSEGGYRRAIEKVATPDDGSTDSLDMF